MRSPRKRISPELGSSAPTRHEKRVVLPAPFGPMMPKMSPVMTSKSTDDRACSPPKRFEMRRAERIASGGIETPPERPRGEKCRQPSADADQAIGFVQHHNN